MLKQITDKNFAFTVALSMGIGYTVLLCKKDAAVRLCRSFLIWVQVWIRGKTPYCEQIGEQTLHFCVRAAVFNFIPTVIGRGMSGVCAAFQHVKNDCTLNSPKYGILYVLLMLHDRASRQYNLFAFGTEGGAYFVLHEAYLFLQWGTKHLLSHVT